MTTTANVSGDDCFGAGAGGGVTAGIGRDCVFIREKRTPQLEHSLAPSGWVAPHFGQSIEAR